MKKLMWNLNKLLGCSLTVGLILSLALTNASGREIDDNEAIDIAVAVAGNGTLEDGDQEETDLLSNQVETNGKRRAAPKEVPWLGVSTEEASETLISQLGLEEGVGLVVTHVVPESPAAKSNLKKNDVLVEFESQALVHPSQLRKLVQSRSTGATVKLAYYRGGKKEEASVTLDQTKPRLGFQSNQYSWPEELQDWVLEFRELPIGDVLREKMEALRDQLGDVKIDQQQIRKEVRRSLNQARKGMRDALRQATNAHKALGPAARVLEDLVRGNVEISKNATVTINNSEKSVNTIVKSDETGTYVIVATPKKHLTAHDPEGNLVFDGPIDTPEQQAKVPKQVWRKVKHPAAKIQAPQPEAEE